MRPESCINMLKLMYLVIPCFAGRHHYLYPLRMKVEEANDKIRAKMKNDIHDSPSQRASASAGGSPFYESFTL